MGNLLFSICPKFAGERDKDEKKQLLIDQDQSAKRINKLHETHDEIVVKLNNVKKEIWEEASMNVSLDYQTKFMALELLENQRRRLCSQIELEKLKQWTGSASVGGDGHENAG